MNKKLIFGTVLTLASISIVTGCSQAPNGTNTSTGTQASSAHQPVYTLKDQAAFTKAMSKLDFNSCNDIADSKYKADCFTAVADYQVLRNAVAKKDIKLCDTITTDALKQDCQGQVNAETKTAQNQAAMVKQVYDQNNQINAIVFGGDYTKCSTLSTQVQINDCQYNIIANAAIAKKDPTLCAKISDTKLQDNCTATYKKVVK